MMEERDIREMIDADIAYGEQIWEEASYDSDRMKELFHRLLERYIEKIEGFSKGLRVLQPYEGTAQLAEVCRGNVRLLLERLKGFRENGCSNEGLQEYYIEKERQTLNLDANFTSVRLEIGMLEGLSRLEREDIMVHLDAMEEICAGVMTLREKWELMRAHLLWLSGKDADIGMKLLPLFFRIN